MHELSLALNIVDIAEKRARAEEASRITEIEIEVGELAGVVYDALDFALDSAVRNTMLENASIIIKRMPGAAQCQECFYEYATDDFFSLCPKCGSWRVEIIKGKEMRVKSITVE